MKHEKLIPLLLLVILNFSGLQAKIPRKSLPNIILINIDDLGWKDVGYMGSNYYETPNIDSLAAEGMIFNQAYATASNCTPSRACMLSGKYTPRHGVFTVSNSDRGQSINRKLIPIENNAMIDTSFLLLPEILQQRGYTTCHAGKWHISKDPTHMGFDINIGGSDAGTPGSYYPPYRSVPDIKATDNEYLTDIVMSKTLDFVMENKENPFFLHYSPYAVHTPIQPVKKLLSKYNAKTPSDGQNDANYATMIENLDWNVGRLITLLKDEKVYDNTFIIFISDNGGHYKVTKQKPLRAGKGSYYEGGIRVPSFAVWKGKIKKGTISESPVINLDLLPTLLDVARIKEPENEILDGVSLLRLLKKRKELKPRPLFWHFPIYLQNGNAECQDKTFRTRPGSAIRLGDWKLIQYFEYNDIELYNLKEDISEKNNLFEDNSAKAEELLSILEAWRKETNAPIPKELNPEYRR